MRTHIDWLSFTITPRYADSTPDGYLNALRWGLLDLFGDSLANTVFGSEWKRRERSRAPYSDAWDIGVENITLFASQTLTHATIEISGQGCEKLIRFNLLNELLKACANRVTRIDIACDIETDVKPAEFVTETSHERMRTSGYQKSETGETCYVGSQKSDRYARVYRYYEPHPRSHLLRIEHVFRRDNAKVCARAVLRNKTDAVARSAGEVFGWRHAVWQPSVAEGADISIVQAERKMGGTVFWLIKQCAPAFRRLCEDGTIRDPVQFMYQYFIPPET